MKGLNSCHSPKGGWDVYIPVINLIIWQEAFLNSLPSKSSHGTTAFTYFEVPFDTKCSCMELRGYKPKKKNFENYIFMWLWHPPPFNPWSPGDSFKVHRMAITYPIPVFSGLRVNVTDKEHLNYGVAIQNVASLKFTKHIKYTKALLCLNFLCILFYHHNVLKLSFTTI